MSGLLQKFLQIALLRAAPQELPGYSLVFWIAIAAVFVTSFAGLMFAYPFADALTRSIAAILIPGAIVYVALLVKRIPSRFQQCYAAMCGASAVVYVIALPLMPAFFSASVSTTAGKLVVMVILLLDVWMLLINAHVFRHTFEVGLATGVSLALALMVLTLIAIESVLPTPASTLAPNATMSLHQHPMPATALIAASRQSVPG
jgi:hypothetical protein